MTTPIVDFVRRYAQSGTARLHMPGHKGQSLLGCEPWDITEIRGADELYEAEGIIAQSEANATRLFGTAHTYYSTEGSSQCIRAMLCLALQGAPRTGKRPVLLAARNAHKALLYAAALLDFDIRWLWPAPEDTGALCSCPVTVQALSAALEELAGQGRTPFGVYLTSPDYLGGMQDIAALSAVCDAHGVPLLVDNAHGAYLRFLPGGSRHPIDLASAREKSYRQTALLALWASALPLVHTHTFLALGLFSGGYLLGNLVEHRQDRRGILIRAGLYLGVVLALALPQLMGNAVKQTLEGGSLRFQFNWVNNSGGYGFKDFYFWFWVKNAGLPFILVVCACLCARRRGYLDIVLGMTVIYVVAETILFQPNEYDNNKLFYIWFMFAMILAADYGSLIMQRLAGLPGRALLCGLFLWASVFSGALSLGREAVSGYQLFSANAVAAGDWIRENTDRDDMFLTGQQHINPVCSLAGRQIICGSDLYVFFHGLDYAQQSADCRRFYENPRENADVLTKYDVHYIYVSDYERAEFDVDLDALDETYELIYENDDVRIYDTGWRETQPPCKMKLTIHTTPGSYAEWFARENKIRCKLLPS